MEVQDSNMVGIPIREFLAASKLPVDIFVRLAPNRYIQVAKAGEVTQIDRFSSYESKKVDLLYVRKEDHVHYINQNISIAGILITRKELENRKKGTLVARVANSVLKEMDNIGFTEQTYSLAKAIMKVTVDLVETKVTFNDMLEGLNAVSDELLSHSIAVSLMSTMIGQAMGWTNISVLEKLALGGLLHDIGLKELPPEVIKKPRNQMTLEELKEYETHTVRGVAILQSVGIVPEDVIQIVHEHHETASGTGFPRKLKSLRIHPLARVVGLANVYCELTIRNRNHTSPKAPVPALDYIEKTSSQHFGRDVMAALRQVVNLGESNRKAG